MIFWMEAKFWDIAASLCTHTPDQIRLKKHPGVIGDLELVDNPQGSQNDLGTISEGSQTQKGVRRVL